jgi:hypothetical protein
VIGFLRFIGVVNAAIWFGAAVFVNVAVPVFFTPQAKAIFPGIYYGLAAEMVLGRFFLLQHVCGAIALVHLFLEWLYTGRKVERFTGGLLIGIFCVNLFAGLYLQPKLHEWHLQRHRAPTVQQREEAKKLFGFWHGVSQTANLFIAAGLLFYLWRTTSPSHPSRLPGFRKVSTGWR